MAAARSENSIIGMTRLPFGAAAFVALVCVAIMSLCGWWEWTSRHTDLRNAEVDMANLARSLTQHAEDTFELADATLMGLASRLETNGRSADDIAGLQKFLELRKSTLGRIRGLFAYDETGRWLATTENVELAGLDNSDRAYFQHHREVDDQRAYLGRPVRSRSGGQWIVTLSRRFNHMDGSFAGVVLAAIDVSYFAEFYRQFDIGPNGAVSLLSGDGILLARSSDDGRFVGRDMSATSLVKDQVPRSAAGTYYFVSPLDGLARLSSYRLGKRYPVLVLATQAQTDVLARWKQAAITRSAIALALTAVIGAIGFLLVRQLLERQRMAAAMIAQEADFRLLAEESSDMVTRIGIDERIIYASPASARVVGWDPDQLVGQDALAGINAEDLPRVRLAIVSLKNGETEEVKIIYRRRHREKTEVWIETALRATRAPGTGQVDGVVGISRDMTVHKDLEDKLAALATLDGLTGLANRRLFDERLEQEWAKAMSERTPLSLLMIDIDHFKSYNDAHGHPAGDRCLSAVAAVLASQAGRPPDLVARYGGEEFAVLLPNTDIEACRAVAAKIRAALKRAAIPHALNSPSGHVTASQGGASAWPDSRRRTRGASLIEAADSALYRAKDSGRDRLVMSDSKRQPVSENA